MTLGLLFLPCFAGADSSSDAASAPAAAGLGVVEAVAGILGYSSWPVAPEPLRLCLLGRSAHALALARRLPAALPDISLEVRVLEGGAPRLEGCAALYVGAFDAPGWRELSLQLSSRSSTQESELAVLTICERSDACSNAGMFSLDVAADGATRFEVNLDAVARSRVRIRPQVLRLGRRGMTP